MFVIKDREKGILEEGRHKTRERERARRGRRFTYPQEF